MLVLYVDVDRFKTINDDLGHGAGDAVLVEVGRRLREAARPDDLVARLGGDEFVLAARMPRHAAAAVAARVQETLDFSVPWHQQHVRVRTSVGAVVSAEHSGLELLTAADRAMYAEKRGRLTTRA